MKKLSLLFAALLATTVMAVIPASASSDEVESSGVSASATLPSGFRYTVNRLGDLNVIGTNDSEYMQFCKTNDGWKVRVVYFDAPGDPEYFFELPDLRRLRFNMRNANDVLIFDGNGGNVTDCPTIGGYGEVQSITATLGRGSNSGYNGVQLVRLDNMYVSRLLSVRGSTLKDYVAIGNETVIEDFTASLSAGDDYIQINGNSTIEDFGNFNMSTGNDELVTDDAWFGRFKWLSSSGDDALSVSRTALGRGPIISTGTGDDKVELFPDFLAHAGTTGTMSVRMSTGTDLFSVDQVQDPDTNFAFSRNTYKINANMGSGDDSILFLSTDGDGDPMLGHTIPGDRFNGAQGSDLLARCGFEGGGGLIQNIEFQFTLTSLCGGEAEGDMSAELERALDMRN